MEANAPAGVLTTATSSSLAQAVLRLTRSELANRRVSFRVSVLDLRYVTSCLLVSVQISCSCYLRHTIAPLQGKWARK